MHARARDLVPQLRLQTGAPTVILVSLLLLRLRSCPARTPRKNMDTVFDGPALLKLLELGEGTRTQSWAWRDLRVEAKLWLHVFTPLSRPHAAFPPSLAVRDHNLGGSFQPASAWEPVAQGMREFGAVCATAVGCADRWYSLEEEVQHNEPIDGPCTQTELGSRGAGTQCRGRFRRAG